MLQVTLMKRSASQKNNSINDKTNVINLIDTDEDEEEDEEDDDDIHNKATSYTNTSNRSNRKKKKKSTTTVKPMNFVCIICLERQRDTIILPCHHVISCSVCNNTMKYKECPICRCMILSIDKIYV